MSNEHFDVRKMKELFEPTDQVIPYNLGKNGHADHVDNNDLTAPGHTDHIDHVDTPVSSS